MCTAQVLLLNRDVLRRNGNAPRSVRRRLFATSDPAGPAEVLKRMQEEIRKKDAERWNFDFFTETPLPGRYQWVRVGGEASNSKDRATTSTVSNPDVKNRHAPVEPIVEEIHRQGPLAEVKKKKGAGATLQHKITDFMAKKKRISMDESSSSKLKVRRVSRNSESLRTTTRLT